MTNTTTKPICFLGQPCHNTECDYCNASKLVALRASARSAFFPSAPERRIISGTVAWPQFAFRSFGISTLRPNLSEACKAAGLEYERVLAGAYIGYYTKPLGAYLFGWAFVLDVPREVRAPTVARQLENAFCTLIGRREFGSSFTEAKPGKAFEAHLDALFTWSGGQVEDCLANSPERDSATIDRFLTSTRSSERIFSQNVERNADGLFLPSPHDRRAQARPKRM